MSQGRRKHSSAFKAKVALVVVKGQETEAQLAARCKAHPDVNGGENVPLGVAVSKSG